jgi:hypothetical protein
MMLLKYFSNTLLWVVVSNSAAVRYCRRMKQSFTRFKLYYSML